MRKVPENFWGYLVSVLVAVLAVAACMLFASNLDGMAIPPLWYVQSWWPAYVTAVALGGFVGAILEKIYTHSAADASKDVLSSAQSATQVAEWRAKNAAFQLHNQGQILEKLQRDSHVTPEGMAILNKWQSAQVIAEKEWTRDNPYPTK